MKDILVIVLFATLANADDWVEMALFAESYQDYLCLLYTSLKYVSRGGLKLEKAMTHFGVELKGKICMDVGASTGGFTDCMLQNGAVKVYSCLLYTSKSWGCGADHCIAAHI